MGDRSKLEDVIHRLKSNDEDMKELIIDCNDLGLDALHYESTEDVNPSFRWYLGALADSMSKNTSVELVHIDSNFIQLLSDKLGFMIFSAVGRLPGLKQLDIFGNYRRHLPVSWVTVALHSALNLHALGLHNATLVGTQSDFQKFSDALLIQSCASLKKFRCFHVQFPALFGLDESIKSWSTTRHTQLEDIRIVQDTNDIDDNKNQKRVFSIPSNDKKSGDCSFFKLVSKRFFNSTATGAAKESNNHNTICSRRFESLSKISTLKRLSINGLKMYRDKLLGLAGALQANSSLQYLNLSYNNLGDDAIITTADALRQNSNLQELYLANNNLGYKSGLAVASLLKVNKTLKVLSLSNNNSIGEDGCAAISRSLMINQSLTKLHLNYCGIGEMGSQAFAHALQFNTSLRELYIAHDKHVKISNAAYQDILKAMKTNMVIQDLVVHPIPYNFESKIQFFSDLNRNGRRDIIENDHITREQWVKCMMAINNNCYHDSTTSTSSFFYFMRLKPSLIFSEHEYTVNIEGHVHQRKKRKIEHNRILK